ncbi:nitroreductase family protein [Oceanidesulfovibrio indonesiensis]|nr:nitroreductase family protein [Oceanidesulfovibrio indonesiensis]
MSRIEIDYDKCVKDRFCIRACPYKLFADSGDGSPVLVENAEDLCIDCGHCLAVCPFGAIALNGVHQEELPDRAPSLDPSPESVEQLFTFRRSIRAYKKTPVERELLVKLAEIARFAPSAVNNQPVHWIMVDSKDVLTQIVSHTAAFMREQGVLPRLAEALDNGMDLILRDAPALAVAHAPSSALSPQVDCVIAATTMELAAASHGLGACWAGLLMRSANDCAPIRELLRLPEDHNAYAALMLGYPKLQYAKRPPRTPARITWI